MATACSLRFSHMAHCQNSNLSSRPSIESRGVQRKPSPGPSAAGGGECWALLPRVELMAVKLINGDESYEAASRSTPTGLPACLQRRRGKKPCFYLLSAALWCLQKPNNKMQLSPFCSTELQECTFESGSLHPQPSSSSTRLRSLSVSLWLSVHILSNNFHVSLIFKGQKLLGSQQWADGS